MTRDTWTNGNLTVVSNGLEHIAPAFVAAQRALRTVKLTASNPHFKSKFAPLSEIVDAAKEALHAHDIGFVQFTDGEDAAGFNLVTQLIHTSGQVIQGRIRMPLEKGTAQAAGSAITYGKRYGFAALLGIVAEDDDDGHAASQKPAPAQAARAPRPRPKPIKERTDAELVSLRAWAEKEGRDDVVSNVDEETERRRIEAGEA